jgi:hypothetical protein
VYKITYRVSSSYYFLFFLFFQLIPISSSFFKKTSYFSYFLAQSQFVYRKNEIQLQNSNNNAVFLLYLLIIFPIQQTNWECIYYPIQSVLTRLVVMLKSCLLSMNNHRKNIRRKRLSFCLFEVLAVRRLSMPMKLLLEILFFSYFSHSHFPIFQFFFASLLLDTLNLY